MQIEIVWPNEIFCRSNENLVQGTRSSAYLTQLALITFVSRLITSENHVVCSEKSLYCEKRKSLCCEFCPSLWPAKLED